MQRAKIYIFFLKIPISDAIQIILINKIKLKLFECINSMEIDI